MKNTHIRFTKVALCIVPFILGVQVIAQKTVPISSTGIGEIKIFKPFGEVEPLLEASATLKIKKPSQYATDTILVLYKGITIELGLETHLDDDSGKYDWWIQSLKSNDPLLLTKSGITIGADKFDVVRKLDGLRLNIMPDWRYEEQPDAKRHSIVSLNDWDNGTELNMYFLDNKLIYFLVTYAEGC